ncbi:gp58-like family protein [Aerococcaceae bacterium WGS1372]
MKFIIDGKEVTGTVTDDYVTVTFTKNTTSDIEVMPLEDCGGVTFLDDIQLEKGNEATMYEDPALVQGPATGLIKEIRALQYSIHDPERGLTSRFAQLAQGFEQEVNDLIGGYSRQGQTIDGLFSEVFSLDGRVSQAIQTVDGFKQTVEDLESGQGTIFEQIVNGARLRVENGELFSQMRQSVEAIEGMVTDGDTLAQMILGTDVWQTAISNKADKSQVSQLADSWALTLKSGNDLKTAINATTSGIRLKSSLIHLDGDTVMTNAFARKLMVDNLMANDVTAFTAKFNNVIAMNLDINSISGNKAALLTASFAGLNSRVVIDGARIRLESGIQGAFVEMNNIPEFRSQFHDGTGVVMAKGRTQYFEPNGGSQAYIGRDIHTGTNDFGIFLSKRKGFRIAQNSESSSATDDLYYSVRAGQGPVNVIEDMMAKGLIVNNFSQASSLIRSLNGWPSSGWPMLHPGDQILYKRGTVYTGGSSDVNYSDVVNFGLNGALTEWWWYFRKHVRYEAGSSTASDRRLKKNIEDSKINALDEVSQLKFKEYDMKADDRHVELGLIAQEAGLLRVPDPETEGLDTDLIGMLALKAIQELQAKVEELERKLNHET